MTIQRYTQGFDKFVPLEAVDNGGLVKYADHKEIIDKKDKIISDLRHKAGRMVDDLEIELDEQKDFYLAELLDAETKSRMLLFLSIFGWAIAAAYFFKLI